MAQEPVRQQIQAAMGLPMAMATGWASLLVDGLYVWHRVVALQFDLLQRQAVFLRTHNHIARGPDWMDHYGRRNRDLNVERV